jgi:hypothetical protein
VKRIVLATNAIPPIRRIRPRAISGWIRCVAPVYASPLSVAASVDEVDLVPRTVAGLVVLLLVVDEGEVAVEVELVDVLVGLVDGLVDGDVVGLVVGLVVVDVGDVVGEVVGLVVGLVVGDVVGLVVVLEVGGGLHGPSWPRWLTLYRSLSQAVTTTCQVWDFVWLHGQWPL